MHEKESSKKKIWETLNTSGKSEEENQATAEVAATEKAATQETEPVSDALTQHAAKALEEQLAKATAEVEQLKTTLLYQGAEIKNIKYRAQLDIEKAHKFSLEKIVKELLPVKDNLERAIEPAQVSDNDAILKGIALILQMLEKVLENNGVKMVSSTIGEAFDPNYHQAMSIQETSAQKPDTIAVILQKGYLLQGRLIRPAAVIVAKAPVENA